MVSRFLFGFVVAISCLGVAYHLMSKNELSDNQLGNSTQKTTQNSTNAQPVSSQVAVNEKQTTQIPEKDQISHMMVDVPRGALPMETMISNLMADRQRAAKEAVELNPFASPTGVK